MCNIRYMYTAHLFNFMEKLPLMSSNVHSIIDGNLKEKEKELLHWMM